MFRLDFRPTYVLNKDLPRLPGVSVSLTYLAHKVRNGKHDKLSVKDTSSEPYSFLSVISRDFIRRFSVQELMNYRNDVDDVPTFVCSNKNLGLFTRLRREQLGYHKITPHEGEELIAYNTFKTCNGEDDIVVRKGTIMTFKKLISGNVMEVVIDNKVHMIVFDKNVFKNVLQTELMSGNRMRLEVDPRTMRESSTTRMRGSLSGVLIAPPCTACVRAQPPMRTTVRPLTRPWMKSSKAVGKASNPIVRVTAASWRGLRSVARRSQTRWRVGKPI